MSIAGDGLVIIGENFNATRKIKITSPKVIQQDGKVGIVSPVKNTKKNEN